MAWRGGSRRKLQGQGHDQHTRQRGQLIDTQAHTSAAAAHVGYTGSSSKRSKAEHAPCGDNTSGYDLQLLSLLAGVPSTGAVTACSGPANGGVDQQQAVLDTPTPAAAATSIPPHQNDNFTSSSVAARPAVTILSRQQAEQQDQTQPAPAGMLCLPAGPVAQAPSPSTTAAAAAAGTAPPPAIPISWLQLAAGPPRCSRAPAPAAAAAAAGACRRLPALEPNTMQHSWLAAAQQGAGAARSTTQPALHHASCTTGGPGAGSHQQQQGCKQTSAYQQEACAGGASKLPPLIIDSANYQQPHVTQPKEPHSAPATASSSSRTDPAAVDRGTTLPGSNSWECPRSTQATMAAAAAAGNPPPMVQPRPVAAAMPQAPPGNLDLLMLWGHSSSSTAGHSTG